MASCTFDGLTQFSSKLEKAPKKVDGWCKLAVFDGTKEAFDVIRSAYEAHSQTGDLVESLGISKMSKTNGVWSTSISFDGYDSKGEPNIVKARVLENGRSYKGGTTKKYKIMRNAAAKAKQPAKAAIEQKLTELFDEFDKEG